MTTPRTRAQRRPGDARNRLSALDGYRGLFVILVVAYHLGATMLVGGWVAINHFFVFSGFLITRLLLHEHVRTGWISARAFYRRRARRVLPAMMILVGAVLLHGVLAESLPERKQHAGDAFSTIFFYLNWRLIQRDDAYFDMAGSPSPLRHAWTLSVEEQFYVVAPLLILGICLLTRRRSIRVAVVAAAAVAATAWTAHIGYHGLSSLPRVYYGTDTRVLCLLVGAAAAFLLGRGADGRFPQRIPEHIAELMGAVGLLVSLTAVFLLEPTSAWMYNSGGMLVYALAAALMGATAADPRDLLLNRVFSWSPLVFLGRISYGIYLYHWPVVLWLPLSPLPRIVAGPIQLAVIIALAAVSFRFVEAPILQDGFSAWIRRLRWRRLVGFGSVAMLALASLVSWQSGVAGEPANVPTLTAGQGEYRPRTGTTKIAVVGDSVAASLAKGWRPSTYPDMHLDDYSKIGCGLIQVPPWIDGRASDVDPQCHSWIQQWPRSFTESEDQGLLIVGDLHFLTDHRSPEGVATAGSPGMERLIVQSLDKARQAGIASGASSISVMNLPCRRIDPQKLDPALRFFAEIGSNDDLVRWTNAVISRWATSRGVHLLDLYAQLCSSGFQAEHRGVRLYHDTLHFDPRAAAMIWTWAAPQVRDHVPAKG